MSTFDASEEPEESQQADDVKEMMKAIASVAFPNGRKDIEDGGTTVRALTGNKLTQQEADKLFSSVKVLMLITGAGSPERITSMIGARAQGKLTADEIQGVCQFITGDPGGPLYAGGDGASLESAVIINCTRTLQGIDAEHKYIERLYAQRGRDWSIEGQFLTCQDNREFSSFIIKFPNGESRTLCFDVSAFFGRF